MVSKHDVACTAVMESSLFAQCRKSSGLRAHGWGLLTGQVLISWDSKVWLLTFNGVKQGYSLALGFTFAII